MNRRQFSSGLLGAAGAIGFHRLAKGTPPSQVNDACQTSIKFRFAGLIVFHPSNGSFELGILRARPDHILQININPKNGDKSWSLDPNILDSYVKGGDDKWSIDVKDKNGNVQTGGVQAATQIPPDRHAPPTNQNPLDLGWMVNVESGEFHGGKLDRLPNKLKPIITLNSGQLATDCLTESVDVYQGRKKVRDNFGFIAGATRLCIDISDGQTVVLKTEKLPDILGLKTGVSYDIELLNTPAHLPPPGGHFHFYYDLLFTRVGSGMRFGFKSHTPPVYSPRPCQFTKEPDPFKCGGIMVNEGSGPLA